MILAANGSYPLLDVMWSIFLFFGLMMFFWLLFTVFGDLFRRDDIGGWAKTGWTVFVICLPFIGAFTYLIAQGRAMDRRNRRDAEAMQQQTDEYIRSVVADGGYRGADEIARAKTLLDNGAISQDEFDQVKRRVLV